MYHVQMAEMIIGDNQDVDISGEGATYERSDDSLNDIAGRATAQSKNDCHR